MLAIQEGHVDIVELLIENHADLDMQNKVHSSYTIMFNLYEILYYHVPAVSCYKHTVIHFFFRLVNFCRKNIRVKNFSDRPN